ncbi:extracellular solute-binding protein [Enterocloster bolteae]|uniref:extracellular solute-binding protein n=1 Tax=Enterocloster bolteae TaxID=208479 RepID=UPI0028DD2423|nr:extracellular solute-binding protein [Enterocloster bolteae]
MKRRFLSAMLSVVMAASLVTGCAGSSSGTADTKAEEVKAGDTKDNGGTGTGNKDTQAASGEQVTLTVMDGYAPEDPHGQYIYQYAEEFMKENPDIKVEIQAIASGDIYTKLAAMATSPDDLPTMFFTSADQVPTLYDLGLTEDLATKIKLVAKN